MTEYAVVITCIAMFALGVVFIFGDNLRSVFSVADNSLAAVDSTPLTRLAPEADRNPMGARRSALGSASDSSSFASKGSSLTEEGGADPSSAVLRSAENVMQDSTLDELSSALKATEQDAIDHLLDQTALASDSPQPNPLRETARVRIHLNDGSEVFEIPSPLKTAVQQGQSAIRFLLEGAADFLVTPARADEYDFFKSDWNDVPSAKQGSTSLAESARRIKDKASGSGGSLEAAGKQAAQELERLMIKVGPENSNSDLLVKWSADIENLSEEMRKTFPTIVKVWREYGAPTPTITSGNDGKHAAGSSWVSKNCKTVACYRKNSTSLHYKNQAVDLRGNNVKDATLRKMGNALKKALGPDYDVIIELFPKKPDNDHIHVGYDP